MKKLIFLLIFIFSASQCTHNQRLSEFRTVGVPYVNSEKVPIIPAVLNGKPCKFIVDTGSSISIVDLSYSEEFNISKKEPLHTILGLGGKGRTSSTGVSTFALGGIEYLIRLRVQNISNVLNALSIRGVVGIIGSDFFSDNGVIVDYGTHTLYLSEFHEVKAKPIAAK